jgi:RNA polymerase sigma-70 factor (ECF subfamily)
VADRSGEFGSFEELAMPLFAKLYNFAHWLTQDRAAAEDLVQETYMKALRGFSSFQQGTNFRAWMYKILRNTFLTTQTGLKAWATVSLDSDSEDEGAAPAEPVALPRLRNRSCWRGVQHGDIQNALEKLPVKFREIVLLCDVEEMSYQEIGDDSGDSDRYRDVAAFSRQKSNARTAGGQITGGLVMTCDPWRDKLDAYVDGDTSQREIAGMGEHLRTCPSCAADALGRLQMKRMTQAAGARYSPSPEFPAAYGKKHSKERPDESKAGLGICLDAETGCRRCACTDRCFGTVDAAYSSRAGSGRIA